MFSWDLHGTMTRSKRDEPIPGWGCGQYVQVYKMQDCVFHVLAGGEGELGSVSSVNRLIGSHLWQDWVVRRRRRRLIGEPGDQKDKLRENTPTHTCNALLSGVYLKQEHSVVNFAQWHQRFSTAASPNPLLPPPAPLNLLPLAFTWRSWGQINLADCPQVKVVCVRQYHTLLRTWNLTANSPLIINSTPLKHLSGQVPAGVGVDGDLLVTAPEKKSAMLVLRLPSPNCNL